jgi:predicted permease
MGTFLQDLRFGVRQLKLSAGFAAVGILSLALGIGANTAIFQLIDAIRLRAIPVKDPATLVTVRIPDRKWGSGSFYGWFSELTYPMYEQIAQRQTSFSKLAVWGNNTFNIASGGEVHYVRGMWVGGDFFSAIGVEPMMGRLIEPSDDVKDCTNPGAVLSYAFWQQNYGGDASIVGKQISLDGYPATVIGVTPPKFTGISVGEAYDVAVPVCAAATMDGGAESRMANRRAWWLSTVGRLKPGATLKEADAQMRVISQQVMSETVPPQYDADSVKKYMEYKLGAFSAETGFSDLRGSDTGLYLLLGISALVLLIACANIANLMLARASSREREIAVRLALGASRGRLIRQLLSESLLLAAAGAVLGSFIAWSLSSWLIAFLSTERNKITVDLSLDWRVLLFTTGIAFLTTLLFGLIPAIRASNAAPSEALKSGARGMTASKEKFGLRRVLVISQVALSLVLLVGAMLFVRSLRNLFTLDAGFQQDGILITQMDFAREKTPEGQIWEYKRGLLDRARAVPGFDSVAAAMTTPLSGWTSNDSVLGPADEKLDSTMLNNVSDNYFATFGTTLLEGRDFNNGDTPTSPRVAIVNQAFVKKFLKDGDPIGKTFRIAMEKGEAVPVFQVVGVVKNAVYQNIHEEFQPTAYFPMSQELLRYQQRNFSVITRSREPMGAMINSMKAMSASASPDIDLDFRIFKTQVKDTLLQDELMATLTGFFGLLAGLLAVIGLYGVISYMVAQRRNEIGVRMAMGAQRGDVLKMVLRDAAWMVGIGIVVGVVIAVLASRGAASMLFGLKSYDPITYLACILALALVATLASLVPARRAAQLDPWTALRDE